jgi:hypothetical protein
MASTLLGSAQFRSASCFSSAGVTHARSLGFLGFAAGAAVLAGAVAVPVVGAGVVAAVRAGGKPDLGAVVAGPVAPLVALALGAVVAGAGCRGKGRG